MGMSDAEFFSIPPRRFWWRVEALMRKNGQGSSEKGLSKSDAARLRKMVEVYNDART